MVLARWQATILDEEGNILPAAQIEVRREVTGSPLAVLYSDRDGLVTIGNPVSADSDGFVSFHLVGGAVRITATLGGFTRTWRYVGIGTLSEYDADAITSLTGGDTGGITIAGGSQSGDDIQITSTTNATKGTINLGSATAGVFVDETDSLLAVGRNETAIVLAGASVNSKITVHSDSTTESIVEGRSHSATAAQGAVIRGARSRGTAASQSVVSADDELFCLSAAGYDGTDYALSAELLFEVDGTPGANDMPGRMRFMVSPDGSQTPAEVFRIQQNRDVLFASGSILTLRNTGLHLLDSNESHDLIVTPGSNLTADRTLTLTTGDSNMTVDFTDPGADRIMFWDDSAGTWRDLSLGAGLSITDTTLNTSGATGITVGTLTAATSGSAIDFTGIPSGVNRITIMFDSVSISGTDDILVQIGDSGGIETTTYVSIGGVISDGVRSTSTAGFLINTGVATFALNGHMVLTRITGNRWISSHTFGDVADGEIFIGGGNKTLSATLDRLRIDTTGTNTFDGAGQINIFYE